MNYMDRIHRSYRESEFNTAPIERKLDFFEMDWNDAHHENEEFNIRYPFMRGFRHGLTPQEQAELALLNDWEDYRAPMTARFHTLSLDAKQVIERSVRTQREVPSVWESALVTVTIKRMNGANDEWNVRDVQFWTAVVDYSRECLAKLTVDD